MTAFSQLEQPTLQEVLLHRAKLAPEATGVVFVRPGQPDETHTIQELLERAQVFRALFGRRSKSHQRLIWICLPPGRDLYAAFLGALLAGQLPSIIAPPSPRMEPAKYATSFAAMLTHLDPDLVVTNARVSSALNALRLGNFSQERLIDAELVASPHGMGASNLDAFDAERVDPDEHALLQHSSGTTGVQKGAALNHAAVLHQVRTYARAIDLNENDVVATWLPLYHDMGFIACFIMPLLTGLPIVHLSPFDWVARPLMLVEAIRAHRATLCWLPNFAYAFMSDAIRGSGVEAADFSTIRAFINCSEPVMASSQRRFREKFGARGLSDEKLASCYAMAENVFAVTQTPIGRPPRIDRIGSAGLAEHRAVPSDNESTIELVSNGPPIDGVEVRIVDETGSLCVERQVGEIRIRGECLFDGYFRRDDLTRQAFDGDWYLTGDLGYLLDGELFVTGRKKDLIVIQGRNFYPSDFETAVGELAGVAKGRVVAFGEEDTSLGTERLILLAETELEDPERLKDLKLAIRAEVAQRFDCTLSELHLVPRKWIVKSTAGKVARADNREKYRTSLKA